MLAMRVLYIGDRALAIQRTSQNDIKDVIVPSLREDFSLLNLAMAQFF